MEFQPTGNYHCASQKVLMVVFENEFGHIRAFIGAGRLSTVIRLQAEEHSFWIWITMHGHLNVKFFLYQFLHTINAPHCN